MNTPRYDAQGKSRNIEIVGCTYGCGPLPLISI